MTDIKPIDIKLPNDDMAFETVKKLLNQNVNIDNLIYFLPTSIFLKLLELNLTRKQKILLTYHKYFTRECDEIIIATKKGYLDYVDLISTINLLTNKENNNISLLYKCLLCYTNFIPNKKFFNHCLNIVFSMEDIQDIINIQWEKGNKEILYFCDKIYKDRSNKTLFFYYPVRIDSVKEYFYRKIDDGLIDNKLDLISSIDISKEKRLELLKRFYNRINNNMNYLLFSSYFDRIKKFDDSEETEAVLVDIWIKLIIMNCDATFPDYSVIQYKNNLAKLEALNLFEELKEEII